VTENNWNQFVFTRAEVIGNRCILYTLCLDLTEVLQGECTSRLYWLSCKPHTAFHNGLKISNRITFGIHLVLVSRVLAFIDGVPDTDRDASFFGVDSLVANLIVASIFDPV